MNESINPVVKWPGGKRALLDRIIKYLPKNFGRYFEPFLGGGALFFKLNKEGSFLGDLNTDLVNFYKQLAENPWEIIEGLSDLKNNEREFYRIRATNPSCDLKKAVRFLYLNRTCFNGLYRTNREGMFNVPFGYNKRNILPNVSELLTVSALIKKANIVCGDFEETCIDAGQDDLVYFDPPYTVTHENNGFIKYNAHIFTWEDQIRLRDLVVRLTLRGTKVVLSNAAHYCIKDLYDGFQIHTIKRNSLLSADKKSRRAVHEYVITNF